MELLVMHSQLLFRNSFPISFPDELIMGKLNFTRNIHILLSLLIRAASAKYFLMNFRRCYGSQIFRRFRTFDMIKLFVIFFLSQKINLLRFHIA